MSGIARFWYGAFTVFALLSLWLYERLSYSKLPLFVSQHVNDVFGQVDVVWAALFMWFAFSISGMPSKRAAIIILVAAWVFSTVVELTEGFDGWDLMAYTVGTAVTYPFFRGLWKAGATV